MEPDDTSRICFNCNVSIREEMSLIEADPRCLRLNVLRGAQRTRCILCPLELGVTRLSIDCRVNIFVNKDIYIPEGARSCPDHLDEYGFILEDFVPQLVYVNRPYVIQGDQLQSFMQGLRKAANAAAKISVDENSYSDDDFTVLTPITKQQFENLYTYCDPIPIQVKNANYVRNVSQKDLLIFLCKMRLSLSDDFLRVIFRISTRQAVSVIIRKVRQSLMLRFVPENIEFSSITREKYINCYFTSFANVYQTNRA